MRPVCGGSERVPSALYRPPSGLTGKKLRGWYDRRAIYRYSTDSIDPETGSIRFWCPQCAGRIRSNLKTRNPKAKVGKNAPFVARSDDAEFCCPGRVTVPVKHLDRYQSIPYGTTAWKKSYNRRNQIENLNGILRNEGGLDDRWCRALGAGSRFVGSIMMGVAYLLGETKLAYLTSKGDADSDPDTPDDNEEVEPGDVDDESTPDDEGHNPGDRSKDGPD